MAIIRGTNGNDQEPFELEGTNLADEILGKPFFQWLVAVGDFCPKFSPKYEHASRAMGLSSARTARALFESRLDRASNARPRATP